MKKYLFIILCTFTSYTYSQQSSIDSLQKELVKYSKPDSNRVNQFIRLASANFYFSPDKARIYIDSAYNLSQKINFLKGLAYSIKLKGVLAQQTQDLKSALDYYYKGVTIAEKIKDTLAIASMIGNIGSIQMTLGLYDSAKAKFDKRIELLNQVSDKRFVSYELAVAYIATSELYINTREYKKALPYAEKGLIYAELSKIIPVIGVGYQTLANINQSLNNQEAAILYYNKAMTLFEQNNLLTNLPPVLIGLSQAYYSNQDSIMAMETIEKSIDVSKKINNKNFLYNSYIMKEVLLIQSNRLLEALNLNALIFRIKDSVLNERNIAEAARKEAQYAADKKELLLRLNFEKETALKQLELINAQKTTRLSQTLLDLERSDKEKIRFKAKQDSSLLNLKIEKEKSAKLLATNTSQKISLKLQREKLVKNFVIVGSIIGLVALITIFYLYKRRRDAIQIQKDLLNKAKITETEMKLLRLQLNPHFLFNSLNSIADYIQKNNTEKADYYLAKFAKLMRSTLESSEVKEITLKEELNMAELYIQLESMRLVNKVSFELNVSEEINAEEVIVPPLILQPFIENSIWHGLSKKEGDGLISIEVKKEDNMLTIYVEDNGVGRKVEGNKISDRKSFGLGLTKERIELLNKIYNTNARLEILDLEEGTRVVLYLPLVRA